MHFLHVPFTVPVRFHPGESVITTLLPVLSLATRHSYNGSGLVISSVDISLNMTSYACFFSVYVGRGQFEEIESDTGFLTVEGLCMWYF